MDGRNVYVYICSTHKAKGMLIALNKSRMWLVLVSLALNVGLTSWLLRPSLPRAMSGPLSSGARPVVSSPAERSAAPNAAAPNAPADMRPAFRWSEIESADYVQYIANLRAAGCPEQTIRDLILADLNQLYAPRAQAIWKPRELAYWQKSRNEKPGPDQIKQLTALDQEKLGFLKNLLGFQPNQQEMIDTIYLQLFGNEQQLLFLPETRREAAMTALTEADLERKEARLRDEAPGSDPERALFDDKLKALAKVLSPEELDEYRLRNSPKAQWLRTEVDYFGCTPSEFKALLDLRNQKLGTSSQDLAVDRATAIADVQKLFGDDRAKEFERVSDFNYQNARRAAERAGVSAELADQAGQITLDAQAQANQIAGDATLAVDERKRQVQVLRTQTEAQLNEVLGEKPAAGVRRNLRTALSVTASGIHP